ncbi:hypothetical protein [Bacillus wiedmannii]|uniref:hypothetical protein n=1 Tax=Bacillus wiedmannii TaxID=1890302 RepID=UPI0039FD9C1B
MDDSILEADHFVVIVTNDGAFEDNLYLPPVLDFETNQGGLKKDQLSEWATIWMERMGIFFQHTNNGHILGVVGNVELNPVNIDHLEQLRVGSILW